MSGIAIGRLRQERKAWRKKHPFGFYARAAKHTDGSTNLLVWKCGVPGKAGTAWEGGTYKVTLTFTEEYPASPPTCAFTPIIFHPNVYGSGKICLSIIDPQKGWQPTITVKQILIGIQDLLDTPNIKDPANSSANELYKTNKSAYNQKIKQEAKKQST